MLSEKQLFAIEQAKKGHNLLILGQSGTGKTFLGKKIEENLPGRRVALTATTGIAALNVGGTTLHSWSGIGDGRFSPEKLYKKLLYDESYYEKRQAIFNTDVLIVDEISMLSMKIFDTLEYVCRKLRNKNTYFGSLQVIAIGDFFQLPPVPDPLKGDKGEYCFNSNMFRNTFKHCIFLHEVRRQSEIDFIYCINEVSKGTVSESSLSLLQRMKRPLPPGPQPVRLCPKKFDCDVYNATQLFDLQGDASNFVAEDSGDKKYLNTLSVPEVLYLKLNCPVLLLKNLSPQLVNGLRGKVTGFSKNTVTVYFDSLSKNVILKPETFTVYCTSREQVVATRIQIPISLAFGITIHKAQGLTLERIEVDGDNIFSPGQLGVAIGRTTMKKNLRLINFNPRSVLKHETSLYEFYDTFVSFDFSDNLQCCRLQISETIGDSKHDQQCCEEISFIDDEHEMSDFSQEEIEEIEKLYSESVDPPLAKDSFENQLKNEIMDIFKMVHSSDDENLKTNSKSWTKYYSEVYKFSVSEKYKKLVEAYIGRKATSEDYQSCRVIFDLVSSSILKEHASYLEVSQANKSDSTSTSLSISESSHGKIRYIGGACVAKCKFHFMNLTRNSLYKNRNKTSDSYLKVKMLDHLCIKDRSVSSKFPKSLLETERKQNVSHGLTTISDNTFEFFLNISKVRLKYHNNEAFALHGSSCLTLCEEEIKKHTELRKQWDKIFENFKLTAVTEEDSIKISKVELYENIVSRFLNISNNEFRKDILQKFGKEKSERLRKKVVSKEVNHKCIRKEETTTSGLKETSKEEVSELPSTSQTLMREKLPKKRKFKSTQKVVSKKKCKKSAVKSKESTDHSDHIICPQCKKVYLEGENWIACDLCDRWYDPVCADLTDDQWADVDNFDWYCAECQA